MIVDESLTSDRMDKAQLVADMFDFGDVDDSMVVYDPVNDEFGRNFEHFGHVDYAFEWQDRSLLH